MALCDSSVLTGQDGKIEFKPPGTSSCVRDFSAFGTDGVTSHITLPSSHDFRVNDVVVFSEEDGGNLDSALASSFTPRAGVAGEVLALGSFVAGSGYPVSLTDSPVTFTGGSGSGATGTVSTDGTGGITAVTLVDGGSGYKSTDQLGISGAALTTGSGCIVEVETVSTASGGSTSAYYVVGRSDTWIEVSSSMNGTPIAMAGDGGTGTADNELPAHINISLADFYAVCGVREFSLEISRDELDVTTLPCSVGVESKLAAFRSTQSGYAEATGSMTVYFSCDQENIANRLLGASILKSQAGARVKLYVCTQTDAAGNTDDTSSLYVDAEINITGMSFSVNPDDPTSAELSFSVTKMYSAFGLVA